MPLCDSSLEAGLTSEPSPSGEEPEVEHTANDVPDDDVLPHYDPDVEAPTEIQVAATALFSALRDREIPQFKELAGAYRCAHKKRSVRVAANVRNSRSAPAQLDQGVLASISEIVSCGLRARATAVLQGSHSLPTGTGTRLPLILQRGGTTPTTVPLRRRPSNIGDWSNADACDWLKEIGCTGEQVELCIQHNMDGTTLLGAPISQICEALSIRRLGARKRTQTLIQALRRRNLADCHAPLFSIPSGPDVLGLSI